MRVILDTNILIGALISRHGNSEVLYQAWRMSRFELLTSIAQLDELRRVSRYPKIKAILPAHRIGAMINNLRQAVVLKDLPDLENEIALNDENDLFLLKMAVAGKADFLITGDRRAGLLQLAHIDHTQILTPTDFCERHIKNSGSRRENS